MIDLECLDLDRGYEHRVIARRLVPAAQGAVARIIHEGVDFDVWPDDRSVHVPLEAWDREAEGQGG